MTLRYLLSMLAFGLYFSSFAQITLQLPVERSVFQRNNDGMGNITISGTSTAIADKIEVKLTDLVNDVVYQEWTPIANQTRSGYFNDQILVAGGWYKLELRTWKDDRIQFTTTTQKVGVGEVFIISGQSNAQGIRNFGAEGAKSDLVNTVNYFNIDDNIHPRVDFEITQLSQGSDIGPNGKSPWCWGVLGDKLVERLGVPVLFFNSAWQGTLSYNWFQSAQDIPTFSIVIQGNLNIGFPYKNLDLSLSQYASLFGLRAVLWMQGETDTAPGIPNYQQYVDFIGYTIRESRKDFGQDIPWVMARTSYVDGITSDLVLQAQRDLIDSPGLNVFEGPFTDTLMIPRYDFVHFGNNSSVKGLDILAEAWNKSLNDDFFSNSQPAFSDPIVPFTISCIPDGVNLKAPNGMSIYRWNNGTNENSRTANSGIQAALISDRNKNFKYSQLLNLDLIQFEGSVTATTSNTEFCAGDSVIVSAQNWENVRWSTGERSQNIVIKDSKTVTYEALNQLGCPVGTSNSVDLKRIDPPTPLSQMTFSINSSGDFIELNKKLNLCDGNNVTFTSDQDWQEYIWNGQVGNKSILISEASELYFQGSYADGCLTPNLLVEEISFSDPVNKPNINRASIFNLELGSIPESTEIVNWYLNGNLLSSQQEPNLRINETGEYQTSFQVLTELGLQCTSELSDGFGIENLPTEPISIYPNPISNLINIEQRELKGTTQIEIYNESGQLVLKEVLEAGNEAALLKRIETSKLNSGVYLVRVSTAEEVLVKKIIKI